MRLAFLTLCAMLLAAAAFAPSASARAPLASAQVVECVADPLGGKATFRGQMRRVRRARRLSMRFVLEEKVGAQRFRRVRIPSSERWHFSRRGVRGLAYNQQVLALPPGASYRVRVVFRWHGRRGRVFRRVVRRSGSCVQPGELPNLQVRRIEVMPREAGTARYTVRVRNTGGAVAEQVPVSLHVDGAEVDTMVVPRIPAGEQRVVSFTGPACRRTIGVHADPDDVIREIAEADNRRSIACPTVG